MFKQLYFISLVVLLSGFVVCANVLANISASPAYVYLDFDQRNPSGTFTITNLSNEPQVYRAKTTHFKLTVNGSAIPAPIDKFSLANWIKFNPKEFTLPPKASRKVRFSIIKRRKIEEHEYWGALVFTPLKGLRYEKSEKKNKYGFEVVTKLVIPIYGIVSNTPYKGIVSEVTGNRTSGKIGLQATISNSGDGGLRLYGEWLFSDKKTGDLVLTKPISRFLVLAKQKRIMKLLADDPLPSGDYSVTIRLKQIDPLSGRGSSKVLLSGQGDVKL